MKIAIITETFLPQTDGIVTRLSATIRWLKKEGHEMLIIAPDLGLTSFEGVPVAGLPARSFFLYKEKHLAMPNRKVGRLLSSFAPDLVHVVNPAVLGVSGIYYARRQKRPLVASYHTHLPKYADYYRFPFLKTVLWTYLRTLHNRADLNLCTSRAVEKELKQKNFHNVKLWERGVDLEQFHPNRQSAEMRRRLSGGRPEKTVLLYVGRLACEKQIETLKTVLEHSDDYCLALVGDGPHREKLEQEFRGTPTVFTGYLHGKELAQAYASADIFVLPSTTETLGLVILEAMASQLPVVTVKGGPTAEQVTDGVSGLLYDNGDPQSLIKAIEQLKDKNRRFKIGSEGRKISLQFGWDAPSRQLVGYYEQVLYSRERGWTGTPLKKRSNSELP